MSQHGGQALDGPGSPASDSAGGSTYGLNCERLKAYLVQMREWHPDVKHPDMRWLTDLFRSPVAVQAAASAPPVPDTDSLLTALNTIMDEKLAGFKETLQAHSVRNSLAEVANRASVMSQREKDRRFRVNAFSQPLARFHAMDLYDIQAKLQDLADHAKLICPQLASNFGTSAAGADAVMDTDSPPVTLTADQLSPLYELLGSLLWVVDDKVHIQQMAGTSRAGYVQMYNHVLKKKEGHTSFSGSRTDREFWAQQKLEIEKEILKEKSHEKQVSALSKATPSQSSAGGSGLVETQGKTKGVARTRHNAKQRKLYYKRQKAKKALAKTGGSAGDAAQGASGTSKP